MAAYVFLYHDKNVQGDLGTQVPSSTQVSKLGVAERKLLF